MQEGRFKPMLARLGDLTLRQRRTVVETLTRTTALDEVVGTINARVADSPRCPHCKGCGKTFNALTGTPLARLHHREAWSAYGEALRDGLSVRKAAEKCGVHYTTTFRWRHRWLNAPRDHKDATFTEWGGKASKRGLSAEQVAVIVVRDRHDATTDAVLPALSKAIVTPVLKPILSRDTLLCTDGAAFYKAAVKAEGFAHQALNVKAGTRVKERVFHIQHVNAYHERLKGWMRRFHDVATKYLPNYLGWRRMVDRHGDGPPPLVVLAAALA